MSYTEGLDGAHEPKKEEARESRGKKTYNTRDSLVVTDPTTSLAVTGLSMGERTGSRIFQYLWSYVVMFVVWVAYIRVVSLVGR